MKLTLRLKSPTAAVPQVRPYLAYRSYATARGPASAPDAPKRKAVTPFNDNGYVPWHELSVAEKASRAGQQTFNFGLVIAGMVLTGGVAYFLYQDVFSRDSKTAYFNRAVDRIKKDPACLALLGDSKKIIAHGEETMNKWRRARPIASTLKTDTQGNEHMMIHFYVEGPLNNGVVNVNLIRRAGQPDFEYRYFFVDVKGHPRIYLENADGKASSGGSKKFRMFGVNWN
ncbi:import inner membrane translocase subunit tim-21, mitochondrial [Xylariaceae sp. FL0804]|nr:import inner membrane translocase subunit tim-21, mitochondrial [Xylariaceae sp. FL0804]